MDVDEGQLFIGKNGIWAQGENPTDGVGVVNDLVAPLSAYALVGKRECDPLPIVHNFGNRSFSYEPPLGYFRGYCPSGDCDADGDGVNDMDDAFPTDPAESSDSDADGIGNNADPDDDNDGVLDPSDAFPDDPAESSDADLDGVGDNADLFPNDPSEVADSDGDGVGDKPMLSQKMPPRQAIRI